MGHKNSTKIFPAKSTRDRTQATILSLSRAELTDSKHMRRTTSGVQLPVQHVAVTNNKVRVLLHFQRQNHILGDSDSSALPFFNLTLVSKNYWRLQVQTLVKFLHYKQLSPLH